MENKPLSIGFIGGATDSAVGYVHFAASRMDNRWKLKAGCFSKNKQINIESAKTYGVSPENLYDSWQDLVANEKGKLDAIVVLTPTPSHFEIVKACLEANIPVICEKALVANPDEAKKLIKIRDKNKGFLAVTYNYSGYPMVRELKHLINKGALGEILHFNVEMPQEGFIRIDSKGNKPTPQSWRLSDKEIPTIYLDLASHLHQLIDYTIKEKPINVVTSQDSDGWFKNIVDNVSCLCRYTKNIQGQIWFSKSALGHRNGLKLKLYGSKASAVWEQVNPEELILSYVNGRREILDRASSVEVANQDRYTRFKAGHPAGFIEAFANLYCDIAQSLQNYKDHGIWQSSEVFSAELALEGLNFFEAMVKSSHSQKWENVRLKTKEIVGG